MHIISHGCFAESSIICICIGRTVQPHMFEVHTQGRVFFLSAPSEDEMQSWVGMLQTLKQYSKVTVSHMYMYRCMCLDLIDAV